jgi:DNA replication and repair protein RecF
MSLLSLQVHQLRNIQDLDLCFSNQINLLVGPNGSGKTSVLEGIHLLALGRSFRTTQANHLITHGSEALSVHGEAHPHFSSHPITLKMVKHRAKKPEYFLGLQPAVSVAELAQHLPVQLLNLEGYQLLGAAPESRRKFVDWMMFHVEQSFFKLWQDFHRVLRQRNALLKGFGERGQLPYWTQQLGLLGQQIHEMRKRVLADWEQASLAILNEAPGVKDLSFTYEAGWECEGGYAELLQATLEHDFECGYTAAGPHRSDFKIHLGDSLARNVLSTGQQKTFVSMLQLAQCQWVAEQTQKVPILLVDDLPSELDAESRKWLIKQLVKTPSQIFLTSVEPGAFEEIRGAKSHKMFHVEHGKVQEVV